MINIIHLKKELKEIVHTNKIIVLPALFLFFGIISPLSARYMNEIISSVNNSGIVMKLPPPGPFDAYVQLFKNFYTMVPIFYILIFMGSVSDEKAKGSLALVLTKGVSRFDFLASKLLANLILATLSILVSSAAFLYYSIMLFPCFPLEGFSAALFMFWLYTVFMICAMLFASTISSGNSISAVLGFSLFIIVSIIAIFPNISPYFPGALHPEGLKAIETGAFTRGCLSASVSTAIYSAVFAVSAYFSFRAQDL